MGALVPVIVPALPRGPAFALISGVEMLREERTPRIASPNASRGSAQIGQSAGSLTWGSSRSGLRPGEKEVNPSPDAPTYACAIDGQAI